MKSRHIFTALLFILILLFNGCDKEESINENEKLIDMQSVFKKTSQEFLPYNQPLKFELFNNQYAVGIKGTEVTNLKIDITPKVKGKAIWENSQSFQFIPKDNFIGDQKYNVVIYPASVKENASNLRAFRFEFTTYGREVYDFTYDIHSEIESEYIWVEGELQLNLEATKSEIISAAKLMAKGKNIQLDWNMTKDKVFQFKTERFLREDIKDDELDFIVSKKEDLLVNDFSRKINLQDAAVFKISSITSDSNNAQPEIIVQFNQPPARFQDFAKLIEITPRQEMEFSIQKEKLVISSDFTSGQRYRLTFSKELLSKTGIQLSEIKIFRVYIFDKLPMLEYDDQGMIHSSSMNNKIIFKSINISKIDYKIEYIYENNLCQYIQNSGFGGYFHKSDMKYVGKKVAEGTFEIGNARNKWLNNEIDISKLIPDNDYGIFRVTLDAKEEYSLYREIEGAVNPAIVDNDPSEYWYWYRLQISKNFIHSDLALTFKQGINESWCYVTDVRTSQPVWGAEVQLLSMQNQVIGKGDTSVDGSCVIAHKEAPFFVLANYKKQSSIVIPYYNKWETSSFDTGGKTSINQNLNAFFYTERGVYRPGDKMNVVIVMRNENNTFPDNHPLNITITDPRSNKVLQTILKKSNDGVYHLPFETSLDAPTGNWNLEVKIGENTFNHIIKIETVAAERLKVSFEPESDKITYDKNKFKIELTAKYLFGRAAAGLKVNFEYKMDYADKVFPQKRWNDFSFKDFTFSEKFLSYKHMKRNLDSEGKSIFELKDLNSYMLPSAGKLSVKADVIDRGGRSSSESIILPYSPWKHYVGLKASDQFLSSTKSTDIEIVLLDDQGNTVSGEQLELKIYENKNYWWWEYNYYSRYIHNFKKLNSTYLTSESNIISSHVPVKISVPPSDAERILVEVTHVTEDGKKHTSNIYLRSRNWRDEGSRQLASILELSSDKKSYNTGETAHIYFPSSSEAVNLITIEKAGEILSWEWLKKNKSEDVIDYEFKITEDMVPGVYVSVSVIQPQNNSLNDCPLRMYGIMPLKAVDPNTIESLDLIIPDIIKPMEKFNVTLQGKPDKDTQFTIAVVDEGLLSLTGFDSPDPWKYFNGKERLDIITSDNYDLFAGLLKGDINNRFAVGGGMETFSKRQIEKTEIKRFKPVCLFSGLRKADKFGKVHVEFDMPDYMGAVRIMAVSVNGNRYGSVSKTIPVRNELMLLPTLPRALAPQDSIVIPVEVFCYDKNINNADIELSAEGPLNFIGSSSKTVDLNDRGEAFTNFKAKIVNSIEPVTVYSKVSSENYSYTSKTEIPVRALQPRITDVEKLLVNSGETKQINITRDGYENSEKFSLQLMRPGYFDYNKHLRFLVRYPYGCLEQKTSAAFPQLFISDIVNPQITNYIAGNIDDNINTAISEIGKHQGIDNRLYYWIDSNSYYPWVHCFAVHFLIEASNKGYHVPPYLIDNAVKTLSLINFDVLNSNTYLTATYHLYVMAKAGKPDLGRMNYIKENYQYILDNTALWMLAGAYQAAGHNDIAVSLVRKAVWKPEFNEDNIYHSFGSINRNLAIILGIAAEIGYEGESQNIYLQLADQINSDKWFSTQTRAFMLWALSKYVKIHPELIGDGKIKGKIKTPDSEYDINIDSKNWFINLDNSENLEISLDIDSNSANFILYYDRIPKNPAEPVFNDYLSVLRDITDENNQSVDLNQLVQGESYNLQLSVCNARPVFVENLALTQILPSGWEIINDRISNSSNHSKTAEYKDIRDDRVIMFFSVNSSDKKRIKFTIPFRAVTAGDFIIPPAILEDMYSPKYTVVTKAGKTSVKVQ